MNKKLTLSIDQDLINFVKKYSKEHNLSISQLFENYLKNLRSAKKDLRLSEKTIDLYGFFKDERLPEKKEMRKVFNEKSNH